MLLISGILCIVIIRKNKVKKAILEPIESILLVQFIVAILIGITMISGYFVENEPIRILRFAILFGTLLCGFEFYTVIKSRFRINSVERNTWLKSTHTFLPLKLLSWLWLL